MSDFEQHSTGDDHRVDEIARKAGAALRRPAPADGMSRLRSSRRRRQTTRAIAGSSAAVFVGLALFVAVDRNNDSDNTITDSVPEVTTSTTPSSGPTESTPPVTTLANAASSWAPDPDQHEELTEVACCGLNWENGQPSPAVPTDATAPLAPGLYNLRPVEDDSLVDVADDGILKVELRPYARCVDLAEFECAGDSPANDDELGVASEAARMIELSLDDSMRVAMSGYACQDDRLGMDQQMGSGTDLARWYAELDDSYETAVGAPLRNGVDPKLIAEDLKTNQTAGFFSPDCPSYPMYGWKPSAGPSAIAYLSLEVIDGMPEPAPEESVSDWPLPTALRVDEQGNYTVYIDAGFFS